MARATVTVAGRTSRPASSAVRGAAVSNSLVDKPFLKPFLVDKIAGKGTERGPVRKVAIVVEDGQTIVVAPIDTGEPAVYVKRKNADKMYRFVRFLTPSEKIEFPGLA